MGPVVAQLQQLMLSESCTGVVPESVCEPTESAAVKIQMTATLDCQRIEPQRDIEVFFL